MQPPDLLHIFIEPLEKHEVEYVITGSIAAVFYGEPRLTHDIDMILVIDTEFIRGLPTVFPIDDYYLPPEEILIPEMRMRRRKHFNIIHHGSGLKADCYLDYGEDELQQWALKHKKRVVYDNVLSVWACPPEYVIIRKLEYYRDGKSQKHIRDIKGMIAVSGEKLNQNLLQYWLEKQSLLEVWKENL